MRRKDKALKEYRSKIKDLQIAIDSGVEGRFEEQIEELKEEWVRMGYDLALLETPKGSHQSTSSHKVKKAMQQALDEAMDDRTSWVPHEGFLVHTIYNFIRQFHNGEYILIKGRRINGKPRLEFIMEALEANQKKVEYLIPSCGYGKVEHIVPREEFKDILDTKVYDSPINLKRVPDEGSMVVAIRNLEGRRKVYYCYNYGQVAELPGLQNYSKAYIRQSVRQRRQIAGWDFYPGGDIGEDIRLVEERATENRYIMENELGWLRG